MDLKSIIASNWLYAISLIDLLGASLLMPLFSTHLRSLGLSHFNIGILNSVFHGAQLISGPIIGNWSDIYGRKQILFISITICALCYGLLGLLSSFVAILIVRLTLGILKHTQSLCKALVADVMPPNEQTASHGRLNAVTSLGFMIGPVLGGHLIEMNNGFRLVGAVVCLIFLLNSAMVWMFVPQRPTKNKTETESLVDSLKRSINDLLSINWKSSWDILLLKFLFGVCVSLYYSSYVFTIQEKFNLSQKYIGYTISFQGMVAAFFSFFAGKFNGIYSANTSTFTRICHFFFLLGLAFLGLGFAQNYPLYVLVIIMLQASCAFLRIITTEMILERSSSEHRGSVIGTSASIVSISKLIGPLIAGFITDRFGYSYTSYLSSLIAFLTCVLCLTMKRIQRNRKSL